MVKQLDKSMEAPIATTNIFLVLVCILLLSTALAHDSTTEDGLVKQQRESLTEAPSLLYRNTKLRCFELGKVRIVEPLIVMRLPTENIVRPDPVGQGCYFTVSLDMESDVTLPADHSDKLLWELLKIDSFSVELRETVRSSGANNCQPFSVSGRWEKGQQPIITFRCRDCEACLGLLRTLRFRGADHDELRSSLRFTFYGSAKGVSYELRKIGLPVSNAVSSPISNAFWIEGDKLLLYTVEANSGFMAYETYQSEQAYTVPQDGSLPKIYRSGLVDQLAQVAATGNWQIVVEMRTAGRMVTQAVFSAEPAGLDKNSWFSPSRLVSTHPFWFGRSDYNIFSIDGDLRPILRRRFMINRHYGGPNGAGYTGFFSVNDMQDPDQTINLGWHGKPPVLMYTPMNGVHFTKENIAFADRFLIFLRLRRPALPPFTMIPNKLPGAFHFEGDKLLLFTVKAHSGHEAVATFLNSQPSLSTATGGPLPAAYRSNLIDSLSHTVIASGKQFMVAEMRVGDRMVSQVVFDVSINRLSLDKQNWFTPNRVVSSHPYQAVRRLTDSDEYFHVGPAVKDPRFQLFSIAGDTLYKRGFLILYLFNNCPGDSAFWTVSDARDPCVWGNSGWRDAPPVLVYTESRAKPLEAEAKFAERFLIYLK